MKIIEIIQLRSVGGSLENLSEQINASIRETKRESAAVTIYSRVGLETDIAIHIHRGATPGRVGPSELGLQLASELKDHGLVDHSLWEGLS